MKFVYKETDKENGKEVIKFDVVPENLKDTLILIAILIGFVAVGFLLITIAAAIFIPLILVLAVVGLFYKGKGD